MLRQAFTQTAKAARHFKAEFDQATYLERTQRNHHWVLGQEGQMRLHDLRVAVAGLGGMGSGVAELLVRLGVGHIKIADPDTIDTSNLNRQVIANQSTIGKGKAESSTQELRNIAKDFELIVYNDGVTAANAQEFVSDVDVVIDEIDVFPASTHVDLHRAARERQLPIYSAFIIGMGTHIYKFQGEGYKIEDFYLRNEKRIASPTPEFLVDRYINPAPSYLQESEKRSAFVSVMKNSGVPIFGATCAAAQSFLVIRMIADFLNLPKELGTPQTPVMPEFIKVDPLDFTTRVCRIDEHISERQSA